MTIRRFGILHTVTMLSLILIPQVMLQAQSVLSLTTLEFIGLIAIIISMVLAIELFVINLSDFLHHRLRAILLGLWGLLIFPLTIAVIIDYKFLSLLGIHPTSHMITAGLSSITSLGQLLVVEVNIGTLLIIIGSVIYAAYLATLGWFYISPADSRATNLALLVASIVFLGFVSGTSLALPATATAQISEPGLNLTDPIYLSTTADSSLDNIVFVILESVRADATTPYNPALATTPFLDQMATGGLTVTNSFVNYAYTTKSLVSILCGIPPKISGHITESEVAGIPAKCLPTLLKPLGYSSAFFHSATKNFENHTGLVSNMGFDEFFPKQALDPTGWKNVNYFGLEERAMTKPIMSWVDQQVEPWLLTVLTLSSHHPHQPVSTWPKIDYGGKQITSDYLNTVRYTDQFLAELYDEFDQRGLLDNTLFIFTGDHGTTLGLKKSDSLPYDENIKVPTILSSKHLIPAPKTIGGLRQHTDLLPTIFDLLNLSVDSGQPYGSSLLNPAPDRATYLVCKYSKCIVRLTDSLKIIDSKKQPAKLRYYDLTGDPDLDNNLKSLIPTESDQQYGINFDRWRQTISELYYGL